jgi:MFS family permease
MTTKRCDTWLLSIFLARIALYANFMVYAACLPVLMEAWDMTATQAGSVSTAFMFGYAASLFVFAWLSDRYGARRMFLLSALLSSATALLFGFFAQSYLTGLLFYGLAAATQGGLYTPAIMLFSDRYDRSQRASAVGWLIASTSVGYAFSLLVSGICLSLGGYRTAFVATGCLPAVGLALIAFALRNTPNTIHPRSERLQVTAVLRRNRNARLLIGGYTAHAWELLGMWSWTPAFFTASMALTATGLGETAQFGAYLAACMHLVGALASVVMGAWQICGVGGSF